MLITSPSNKNIKYINELNSSKKMREREGLFVVEGMNAITELPIEMLASIYVKESMHDKYSKHIAKFSSQNSRFEKFIISDILFDKISNNKTPQGILAICKVFPKKALGNKDVVLLDKIRDPGNLGTIFRTAVAFGLKDFLLIDCVDVYSPKVIRSSLGAVLKANIYIFATSEEAINFLKLKDISIVSLSMEGDDIYSYNDTRQIAIAVGGEAAGISQNIRESSTEILRIPMTENMESLNAAISFSIASSYITHVKERNNFLRNFKF